MDDVIEAVNQSSRRRQPAKLKQRSAAAETRKSSQLKSSSSILFNGCATSFFFSFPAALPHTLKLEHRRPRQSAAEAAARNPSHRLLVTASVSPGRQGVALPPQQAFNTSENLLSTQKSVLRASCKRACACVCLCVCVYVRVWVLRGHRQTGSSETAAVTAETSAFMTRSVS